MEPDDMIKELKELQKEKDRPKGMVVGLEEKGALVMRKIKALINIGVFSKSEIGS
jgi:ribosomal protein L7Ae-like RNA K-turn-binding protein